jgi:hypothetical protein
MLRPALLAFALVLAPVALSACSKEQAAPLASPSSDQPSYANRYPDEVVAVRGRFEEQEGQARRAMGTFATFPDELDKPNWNDVQKVYDAADSAGHSQEYVDSVRETEGVSSFFKDEKDEIDKKVGGTANYTAKQKGCDVDLYGATSNALDKAVEKQLEKRLREHNEAQTYIDEHEDSLGKPNREKLEKQADDIAYTSYLSRVATEQTKRDLEALVNEAENVKKTLDREIEESNTAAGDASRSDNEKKKAQARAEAAQKAKERIDSEIQESQKLLKDTDDRIKNLRSEYDKAFDELKQKVQAKASETPAS